MQCAGFPFVRLSEYLSFCNHFGCMEYLSVCNHFGSLKKNNWGEYQTILVSTITGQSYEPSSIAQYGCLRDELMSPWTDQCLVYSTIYMCVSPVINYFYYEPLVYYSSTARSNIIKNIILYIAMCYKHSTIHYFMLQTLYYTLLYI